MKAKIDISDASVHEVGAQQRPAAFKLRDGSFGANAGSGGQLLTRWEDIRQVIYECGGE